MSIHSPRVQLLLAALVVMAVLAVAGLIRAESSSTDPRIVEPPADALEVDPANPHDEGVDPAPGGKVDTTLDLESIPEPEDN